MNKEEIKENFSFFEVLTFNVFFVIFNLVKTTRPDLAKGTAGFLFL